MHARQKSIANLGGKGWGWSKPRPPGPASTLPACAGCSSGCPPGRGLLELPVGMPAGQHWSLRPGTPGTGTVTHLPFLYMSFFFKKFIIGKFLKQKLLTNKDECF